jgi:ABC-type multidrug transport system ATPase subunit
MTPGAAIQPGALTQRYGRRRGIEGVTLSVEPGEVFASLNSRYTHA